MTDVKAKIDAKIAGKKVMVFSKSSCPFCTKAKKILSSYLGKELAPEEYEVMEIESLSDCAAIQDYLAKVTGGRTVPRIFISGKSVGGCDDLSRKHDSGDLKSLLA